MDDGFADLIAKLDAVKGDELKKAHRKALKRVGKIIQDAIVSVAPVQAGVPEGLLEPGQLRESITTRVHIATDESTITGDNDRVTIGPNTKVTKAVANWVENGHANARAKTSSKRTKPHPFVRPSFDAVEQTAIDAYAETMTIEVKKALE